MLVLFIYNIAITLIILIILTLIAGILPLIERKLLSLTQRRVGPFFLGYRGRLQYIADALKILLKDFFIPYYANKTLFIFSPALTLGICYIFWLNIFWGKNIIYYDIEYNLILLILLGIITNVLIILTGYYSNNKYAFLGGIRTAINTFLLELLMGLLFLNIILVNQSFSLIYCWSFQEEFISITYFFFLLPLIFIILLLEVCKAPFDLNEAESELVSGYQTEYGSFLFGLYYLGEYFHIFFFSAAIIIIFFGC